MTKTNEDISRSIANRLRSSIVSTTRDVLKSGEAIEGISIREGMRQFGDATLSFEIAGKLVTITIAVESIS